MQAQLQRASQVQRVASSVPAQSQAQPARQAASASTAQPASRQQANPFAARATAQSGANPFAARAAAQAASAQQVAQAEHAAAPAMPAGEVSAALAAKPCESCCLAARMAGNACRIEAPACGVWSLAAFGARERGGGRQRHRRRVFQREQALRILQRKSPIFRPPYRRRSPFRSEKRCRLRSRRRRLLRLRRPRCASRLPHLNLLVMRMLPRVRAPPLCKREVSLRRLSSLPPRLLPKRQAFQRLLPGKTTWFLMMMPMWPHTKKAMPPLLTMPQ